jgi:hypothetical protein
LLCTATPLSLWLSMFVSLLTFVLRSWRRAGAVLQRRVRGAVPAVAGGQREEGGEAPEDRPVMEGDRRSWYARGGLCLLHSPPSPFAQSCCRVPLRLGPGPPFISFGNLLVVGT